jgi:hypothetical protein
LTVPSIQKGGKILSNLQIRLNSDIAITELAQRKVDAFIIQFFDLDSPGIDSAEPWIQFIFESLESKIPRFKIF